MPTSTTQLRVLRTVENSIQCQEPDWDTRDRYIPWIGHNTDSRNVRTVPGELPTTGCVAHFTTDSPLRVLRMLAHATASGWFYVAADYGLSGGRLAVVGLHFTDQPPDEWLHRAQTMVGAHDCWVSRPQRWSSNTPYGVEEERPTPAADRADYGDGWRSDSACDDD